MVDENCGPVCTDLDGDNYSVEGGACGQMDCDDTDATITLIDADSGIILAADVPVKGGKWMEG